MQEEKILSEYPENERAAYIIAIASLSTADHSASPDELEFLDELAQSADFSPQQKQTLHNAATGTSEIELKESLDVLKNSDLRFSLLTDLITFAESDKNYSQEERMHIEKMAAYLNINNQQLTTLKELAHKSASQEPVQAGAQNFFGMEDKLKNAGINFNGLGKGLLGMIAPMILGRMLGRGGRSTGGGLGGMLGGLLGGGSGRNTGGLGSIISMINGGRGTGGIGGLLGKLFR